MLKVFNFKILTNGSNTKKFENQFAKYTNSKYATAVSNATAALHLSLNALGIGKNDEVIVPNITFLATANSILMTGATPVLVDVNLDDLNININSIKNSVNLRLHDLLIKKESESENLSANLIDEVESYHKKMVKQIKRLGKFFEKYDQEKIDKIVSKGKQYKDLEEKYRIEHIKRSGSDDDQHNPIYQELMDMLKEISIFIDLIAERLGELEEFE